MRQPSALPQGVFAENDALNTSQHDTVKRRLALVTTSTGEVEVRPVTHTYSVERKAVLALCYGSLVHKSNEQFRGTTML